MFYYLSQMPQWLVDNGHAAWADWLSFLRVFQYITFRTAGAAVTALLLSWWLGPKIIAKLKQLKFSQQYEDKAEQLLVTTSRKVIGWLEFKPDDKEERKKRTDRVVLALAKKIEEVIRINSTNFVARWSSNSG